MDDVRPPSTGSGRSRDLHPWLQPAAPFGTGRPPGAINRRGRWHRAQPAAWSATHRWSSPRPCLNHRLRRPERRRIDATGRPRDRGEQDRAL